MTPEDIKRMEAQKDVDGLIQVLQGDDVPEIRALSALALGRLGDPKARWVLQAALLSDEPQVMGAASTAFGQLEASITMGTPGATVAPTTTEKPIIQEEAPEEVAKHEQAGCKGKLWKAIYSIGILLLIYGGLFFVLAVLTSGSSVVDWTFILTNTVISAGIGGLLVYLSTRPIKPKQSSEGGDL